jgi:hypothetical protein
MPRPPRSSNVSRPSRRLFRAAVQHVAALESRLMMHAGHVHDEPLPDLGISPAVSADVAVGVTTNVTLAAASPLTSVPALSSRPAAPAKLYLDFDGNTTATWGDMAPGTTPAYDSDGDATTFSDAELASIREIHARVAEKYSPFNIDVTTVNPGTMANRVGASVVFGGAGAWLGGQAGGVAYVGGFYNSAPNSSFVFTKNLANGYAKYAAEAAAHESGHLFGLDHQSAWTNGVLTSEYAPADANGNGPIMGSSYTSKRGLWWYGTPSSSGTVMQDDLAVLANSYNNFGYRADDFGNDLATASALTLTNAGTTAAAAGVITRTGDLDVFSFTAGAGAVSFTTDPAAVGAMLDLKLTLRDASGAVLASADSAALGETVTATLTANGTYYLTVASHGGYGDVGQYAVRGTVTPAVVAPSAPLAAPTGLTAVPASATAVDLKWTDATTGETGFVVQRSTDNGVTWTQIGTAAADATTYRDATAAASTAYAYRLAAVDLTRQSAFTDPANATTPAAPAVPVAPTAPTGVVARALTSSSVRLTWADTSSNETNFRIYTSRDGKTWTVLGTVGANVTTVDNTGLRRNTTYYYKVRAFNAVGDSPDSNTTSARTSLATAATAMGGDFNLDGAVDFADLTILSQNYEKSTTGGWEQGDANHDGVVDFADLVVLSQNYDTTTAAAANPDDGTDTGTLTLVTDSAAAAAPVAPLPVAKKKAVPAKAAVVKPAAKPVVKLFSTTPVAAKAVARRA